MADSVGEAVAGRPAAVIVPMRPGSSSEPRNHVPQPGRPAEGAGA